MRILIANDDGIYSPGILALAEVASEFGEVRIVAPDVEPVQAAGGLDDSVRAITTQCRDHGVPCVFALSRDALGPAVWQHKGRVSAVAVYSAEGAYDELRAVTAAAKEAQQAYTALTRDH